MSAGTSLAWPVQSASAERLLSGVQYSAPAVRDQLWVEVHWNRPAADVARLGNSKPCGLNAGLPFSWFQFPCGAQDRLYPPSIVGDFSAPQTAKHKR